MPRVLVIEDNPANLELMTYLLKAFGHEPVEARDGVEGLAVARREQLDLIICDVHLPKLDGYEVIRELKRQPALRGIPTIAVTALAMVGDRDKVLAAGFDGYIAKPITPETFVDEVKTFLRPGQQATSPPPVSLPTLVPVRPHSTPATILVVDNSLENLHLASSTLETFGYRVITARHVTEALALARQTPPDLILSDLHMPKGSGHDLLAAAKADPQLRSIPFVFISATMWPETDPARGLALGADRFILRPIEPPAFLAAIESCLRDPQEKEK